MSSPITFEQALEYHQGLLLAYGGTPGLQDAGALQSALAQPHLAVFGLAAAEQLKTIVL